MTNYAVSTMAFGNSPVEEMISIACSEGFCLEFSSGLPYQADMVEVFYDAPCERLIHNYFPSPKVPFVLNLASVRDDIRRLSISHAVQGIQMAARVGAPFYSVHAGFCVDPAPEDLGGKFPEEYDSKQRPEYWDSFIESVRVLLKEAGAAKVMLLIENNVMAPSNITADGEVPALCLGIDEVLRLFDDIGDDTLGLLLDTAHLKVAAQSLGFSRDEFVVRAAPHIRALHHSDNNGMADTNEPLTSGYWFLQHMNLFNEAYHILEVHNQSISEIKSQLNLLSRGGGVTNQ